MLTSLLLASLPKSTAPEMSPASRMLLLASTVTAKASERPVEPQPWAATTFPVVPSSLATKMNAIPRAGAGDDVVKKLAGVPTP